MNQFPANAIPGFQPPPGMVPGMMHPSMIQQLPPGMAPPPGMGPPPGVVPGGPPGGPGGAPPEMLQQQYLHQQQLAMAQAMRQQQLQQQQHAVSVAAANAQAQAAQAPPRPKARKGRPPVLPRGQQGDYVKGAMAPPTVPAVRQTEVGNAATGHETEPWADMLDELDPRELAMARFRARQEVMTEIFGPERVREYCWTRSAATIEETCRSAPRPTGRNASVNRSADRRKATGRR